MAKQDDVVDLVERWRDSGMSRAAFAAGVEHPRRMAGDRDGSNTAEVADWKAVRYATALSEELRNYLLDGALEIDKNLIQNAIRPLALGRKNYLFAGSHDGAENIAMYRSFLATCRLAGQGPHTWLLFVMRTLPVTPPEQYATLLPPNVPAELLRPYQTAAEPIVTLSLSKGAVQCRAHMLRQAQHDALLFVTLSLSKGAVQCRAYMLRQAQHDALLFVTLSLSKGGVQCRAYMLRQAQHDALLFSPGGFLCARHPEPVEGCHAASSVHASTSSA